MLRVNFSPRRDRLSLKSKMRMPSIWQPVTVRHSLSELYRRHCDLCFGGSDPVIARYHAASA